MKRLTDIPKYLLVAAVCAACLAQPATAADPDGSWSDSVTRYIPFMGSKSDEPDKSEPAFGEGMALSITDFLEDSTPGISDYRKALAYAREENQPRHTAQEVFDLYMSSARQGNVLALVRANAMLSERNRRNKAADDYMSESVKLACEKLYPVAVTGNADAQYAYATQCIGVKKPLARSWLMRSYRQYEDFAGQNVPYARHMIGLIHRDYGEVRTSDSHFEISAKAGYSPSVCRMSLQYFYDEKVWDSLPAHLKTENSCAVRNALKVILLISDDKAVRHTAEELLNRMPKGYRDGTIRVKGHAYHEDRSQPVSVMPSQSLTFKEQERAAELMKRYGGNSAAFVGKYLNGGFDWSRLNVFGW